MSIRLLLIEDDPNFLEIASAILNDLGPDVSVFRWLEAEILQ